jgi:hypothetical protein
MPEFTPQQIDEWRLEQDYKRIERGLPVAGVTCPLSSRNRPDGSIGSTLGFHNLGDGAKQRVHKHNNA